MSKARRWMSRLRYRVHSPFLCFFFHSGPQLIGWKVIFFLSILFPGGAGAQGRGLWLRWEGWRKGLR